MTAAFLLNASTRGLEPSPSGWVRLSDYLRHRCGTIFELRRSFAGLAFHVLHAFEGVGADGAHPVGLTLHGNALYGALAEVPGSTFSLDGLYAMALAGPSAYGLTVFGGRGAGV